MNARRKIEVVLADIFNQYLAGSGIPVVAGRNDNNAQTPFLCINATEVVETIRGSGVYLGDVKFVVITSSNDELSAAQDTRIGEAMDLVRELSNTLCSGNSCITDEATNIVVDGMAQMSQGDALDDESYGDMVYLRVGFREVDSVAALAPVPNTPQVIPPWWNARGVSQART